MRVTINTVLDCPPQRAWQELRTARLLRHITWPILIFRPLDPPQLPDQWEARSYWVSLWVLGILPFGRHAIVISIPAQDEAQGFYQIRDAGHGKLVAKWDHWITLAAGPDQTTRYRDEVEVQAGLLTPFIWLFAQVFYRYRQWRWRGLVKGGFRY